MIKKYVKGDYIYILEKGGWRVELNEEAINEDRAIYGEILSEIDNIPVTSAWETFSGCTSLRKAPAIPESVINMNGTFAFCTSLKEAPSIPEGVKGMYGTFYGCTSLKEAPAIPEGVKDLTFTFTGCTSLRKAPVIPGSVKDMFLTFAGCESLTEAPAIPKSVEIMYEIFQGCTSLKPAAECRKPSLSEQINSAKAEAKSNENNAQERVNDKSETIL